MFEIFTRSWGDEIDFESMYEVVIELGIRGYKMQHQEICQRIWDEMVPASGQAETLQGELLRRAEKLRYEAQSNGNRNWDGDFDRFCAFIGEALGEEGLLDAGRAETLPLALSCIRECGCYARRYREGELSDDEVNPMLFAYVDDDLYDYIEDAVADFAMAHPEPIPYTSDPSVRR